MKAVALVTGAAGGMGQAIVRRLAQDGFKVVAVDRSDAPLQALAQRLGAEGLAVEARVADLTDETQVHA
ncbi:MAG TPA: SDR family NAD(P)-dependent oxidoreductase, partial [Castellaniella sp.]|nr:SDR family NAD(P)-dependent oxidoreductase [Castellaniella sp.]